MVNKKCFTKNLLAIFLVVALIFSGMTFAMQKSSQNAVYAEDTPTIMQKSFDGGTVNFYPVFADGNAPSGVTFYTQSGGQYTEIENPTMSSIASAIATANCPVYFSGGDVKCFAVVQKSWNNTFSNTDSGCASGLNEDFNTKLTTAGLITPYFNASGWNCSNWDADAYCHETLTIDGISIDTIYNAYSSAFNNTTYFWLSRAEDEDYAYTYDKKFGDYSPGPKSQTYNVVLLCELTPTNNNSGNSGDTNTGIATNLAVGLSITLACLALTATYVVTNKKKKIQQ